MKKTGIFKRRTSEGTDLNIIPNNEHIYETTFFIELGTVDCFFLRLGGALPNYIFIALQKNPIKQITTFELEDEVSKS